MRISDWSSDVCSSDLGWRTARAAGHPISTVRPELVEGLLFLAIERRKNGASTSSARTEIWQTSPLPHRHRLVGQIGVDFGRIHRLDMRRRKLEMARAGQPHQRSEEHTSELPSLI